MMNAVLLLAKAGALLVGVVGLLLTAGLLSNEASLSGAPGWRHRLMTYLTQNVAETSTAPIFPELQTRRYRLPPQQLFEVLQHVMTDLKWPTKVVADQQWHLQAVVTTPLWQFKDDIEVRVFAGSGGGSELWIRSRSRVGRGDLGANRGHILQIYSALAGRNVVPTTEW